MPGNNCLDFVRHDHCRDGYHDHCSHFYHGHRYNVRQDHHDHNGCSVQKSINLICGSDHQIQIGFSGIPYSSNCDCARVGIAWFIEKPVGSIRAQRNRND